MSVAAGAPGACAPPPSRVLRLDKRAAAGGATDPAAPTVHLDKGATGLLIVDHLLRDRRIMVITPAFQAGDVGSIPIGRSPF